MNATSKQLSLEFDNVADPETSPLCRYLLHAERKGGGELDVCRLVLRDRRDGAVYASVVWAYVDAHPVVDRPYVRSDILGDPSLDECLVGAAICSLTEIDGQVLAEIWITNDRIELLTGSRRVWPNERFSSLSLAAAQKLAALGQTWLRRDSELLVGRDGLTTVGRVTKLMIAKS